MDWISVLAVLATLTSFVNQLVGLEICFRIVKKKSAGEISPAPFVAYFIGACIWLKYGLMVHLYSLIYSSAFSAVLQFLYIIVYYIYTSKKHYIRKLISLGIVLLLSPLLYVSYYEVDADMAIRNLGFFGCGASVLGYASPLASLSDVFRHKSTESMSFSMCSVNMISAVEWTLYGLAINDKFVSFPSILGGMFSVFQLSLFCAYGFKRKKQTSATLGPI